MMRVPIWATAFIFVAGASLAAPALDAPMRAPQPERPTLSEDWGLEALELAAEEELTAEAFQIAGKRRGGGGKRGGARSKSRGGFKAGNKRQALRGGKAGRPGRVGDPGGLRGGKVGRPGRVGDPGGVRGGVHRDVDIDRRVDVDRRVGVVGGGYYGGGDWDDDDDELEAALLGGVVGMGIGAMLNDSQY
jgi:hypothetical protein